MKQYLAKAFTISDYHGVIEYISHTLKKPIILEDDGFNLLSYSSYYIKDFDLANQQTILSKKCPETILEKFKEEGIIGQLQSTIGPFHVRKIKEVGLNSRVVVSTRHKGAILGYLWVQEIEDPLTSQELEFLEQVAFHIGKVLHKVIEAKREKDEKRRKFYRELLNNKYKTEKELKNQAEIINIVLPAIVQVVVFAINKEEEEWFEGIKEQIQSAANAISNTVEIISNSGKIIVVLGYFVKSQKLTLVANDLVESIVKWFSQSNTTNSEKLFVGVGNEHTVAALRDSFLEASEVIKIAEFLGSQDNMPHEYQKLGIYKYVPVLASYHNERQYVNPELLKLKQKDEENQTELIKTLEVYLLNNCKAKQTAEQLYIHPNTLNYRIKQIHEYTNLVFNDFNMNCQLYIDLLLMKRK